MPHTRAKRRRQEFPNLNDIPGIPTGNNLTSLSATRSNWSDLYTHVDGSPCGAIFHIAYRQIERTDSAPRLLPGPAFALSSRGTVIYACAFMSRIRLYFKSFVMAILEKSHPGNRGKQIANRQDNRMERIRPILRKPQVQYKRYTPRSTAIRGTRGGEVQTRGNTTLSYRRIRYQYRPIGGNWGRRATSEQY